MARPPEDTQSSSEHTTHLLESEASVYAEEPSQLVIQAGRVLEVDVGDALAGLAVVMQGEDQDADLWDRGLLHNRLG